MVAGVEGVCHRMQISRCSFEQFHLGPQTRAKGDIRPDGGRPDLNGIEALPINVTVDKEMVLDAVAAQVTPTAQWNQLGCDSDGKSSLAGDVQGI